MKGSSIASRGGQSGSFWVPAGQSSPDGVLAQAVRNGRAIMTETISALFILVLLFVQTNSRDDGEMVGYDVRDHSVFDKS